MVSGVLLCNEIMISSEKEHAASVMPSHSLIAKPSLPKNSLVHDLEHK